MDYKASMTVKKTVIYILMVFFVVIALVPIYLMLINATRSTEEINAGLSLLPSRFSVQNWNLLRTGLLQSRLFSARSMLMHR